MRFSLIAIAALFASALAQFEVLRLDADSKFVAECAPLTLFWLNGVVDKITIGYFGSPSQDIKLNATQGAEGVYIWHNKALAGYDFTITLTDTAGYKKPLVWGGQNGPYSLMGSDFSSTPGTQDCW